MSSRTQRPCRMSREMTASASASLSIRGIRNQLVSVRSDNRHNVAGAMRLPPLDCGEDTGAPHAMSLCRPNAGT